MVRVRYFAAAEEAAGLDEESRSESTVGELRVGLAADHPRLGSILAKCSLLVAGLRADSDDVPLPPGTLVDVLPPFAGG